jgi:HD-like signal output (HDOD) protein
LALEHGTVFAATAATVSLSAVLGAVVFILTYARVCARRSPAISLLSGLAAWCGAALLLTRLPPNNSVSLLIAALSLVLAPKLFPRITAPILAAALPRWELPLRMLAGAAVTLAVTTLAAAIGPSWSGMFAVFPVITIVMSVFSHRASGPAFTATLLRAMIWGLYSLASFCLALAVLLPRQSISVSFLAAIAVSVAVQWALKSRLHRR